MTRLWEQNKALLLVAGGCLLLLLVTRPTVLSVGPPLARWMGAGWKQKYDELWARKGQIEGRLAAFDPPGGKEITEVQADLETSNQTLRKRFDDYVRALVFAPYSPYLPPPGKKLSGLGPYFTEELQKTRYGSKDEHGGGIRKGLLQYCTSRRVQVAEDLGFGKVRRIPSGNEVPALLRQLAVVDTFVKLCANSGVAHIKIEKHQPRVAAGTKARAFFWAYPMEVKLRTGHSQLMTLLNSLNGRQALVSSVEIDPSTGAVGKVTLDIGSAHGVEVENEFTLLKRTPDRPCDLRYAGRVVVTKVMETECIARALRGALAYDPFDGRGSESQKIAENDWATTGFFRVSDIQITAVPGGVGPDDKDGIPTAVTPHMLKVNMVVSTIEFNPKTLHITVDNMSEATNGRLKPRKKKVAKAPKKRKGIQAGPSY